MTREELEKQILEILTRDRIGSHSPHKHLEDFAKEITSLIEKQLRDKIKNVLIEFRTTDIEVKFGQTSEDVVDEYLKQKGLPL